MTVLLNAERHWECPLCPARDVTLDPKPHTRYHICPAQSGMTVPMVPAGMRAKVTRQEREDYIGTSKVQLDDRGRPVMSITVEREDGLSDTVVFAPTALSGADMKE